MAAATAAAVKAAGIAGIGIVQSDLLAFVQENEVPVDNVGGNFFLEDIAHCLRAERGASVSGGLMKEIAAGQVA